MAECDVIADEEIAALLYDLETRRYELSELRRAWQATSYQVRDDVLREAEGAIDRASDALFKLAPKRPSEAPAHTDNAGEKDNG